MVRHKRKFRRPLPSLLASKPQPGSAPGVLKAQTGAAESRLELLGYGPKGFEEKVNATFDDIEGIRQRWPVVMVNMIGLADVALLEKLGEMFALDKLLLEDVLDTSSRPKVEFHDDKVFAILKGGMMAEQIQTEHLALFLQQNLVLVFEEKMQCSFTGVRERVARGVGRIRHLGADYLFYALIDEVLDRYFPLLDHLNTVLAQTEDAIIEPKQHMRQGEIIEQIHHAKTDLMLLHRTVWPISDLVGAMLREDTPLISKPVRGYLRDCYDHAMQLSELTQFYRDTSTALMNTFLAYEGHKTNEIVKVLTMISAVFIPLNFIAGVYGMNFHPDSSPWNMPELKWYYGYPFALGLMMAVALFMLFYFRHKGWTIFNRRK